MAQSDVPDFFGFHPYEFLSDERVLAMDLQQVGAYLLLMISQWINGSVPADLGLLAKILKQSPEDMERIWVGVGPCFSPHPELDGRLIQAWVEWERVRKLDAMRTERARVKAHRHRQLGPNLRFKVLKRDQFRCVYCGRAANPSLQLEVDHVIAVAKGGTNAIENLVTACRDCNRGKRDG